MKKALFSTIASVAVLAGGAAYAQCDWKPDRPVTYIVPWGAGGTTDVSSRMIAAALQEAFGRPVNVVNRTGGNGVTGHSAIARARPDGYTVGAVTVEINTMHFFGLTDLTYNDITPIAMTMQPPASIVVGKDSPFQSVTEIIDYARENPGTLKASGTSLGGIWHLALAGMLSAEGVPSDAIVWVPSQGSASAMQELIAGGVDLISPSLEEAKAMIDAGEVRALGVMSAEENPHFPGVKPTGQELPSGWTMAAYTTISGPPGLPEEIACSYEAAVKAYLESDEWKAFQQGRGGAVVFGSSAQLAETMASYEEYLGKTIADIGVAQ